MKLKILVAILSVLVISGGVYLLWPEPVQEVPREQVKEQVEVEEDGVLYLTTITHLEKYDEERGWWDYSNEDYYDLHVEHLLAFSDLYDEYGAVMTVEASMSIAENIPNYDFNILAELESRGFGIGAHMDLGVDVSKSKVSGVITADMDYDELVSTMATQKDLIDALLEGEIVHNSGTPFPGDWVGASVEAGFSCHTSAVSYYLASLDEENRIPGWTDEFIMDENYHSTYPFDHSDRIHPWGMSSSENWIEEDPDGELFYIPGESGLHLDFLHEFYVEGVTSHNELLDTAEFTVEDVDAFMELLDKELRYVEAGEMNSFYVMVSMNSINADRQNDFVLFRDLLGRIGEYVEEGEVEWRSIPEVCGELVGSQ